MSAPTTTSTLSMQSFFSTTLSSAITSSDTVIPLSAVPTGTEGFLVIDQDNASKEIIYYNTKGGSSVTIPSVSTGRAQGGTTAVSHLSGATVKMNMVDQYWSELQNGHALKALAVSNAALAANVAWTTWSPTLTNWTIGTGGSAGTTAKYQQIGKTVHFYIKSTLGTSGQSVGTNAKFTLPTTTINGSNTPIGNLQASGSQMGVVWADTTTTAQLIFQVSSTAFLTATGSGATVPITWAAGDSFTASGYYETA